MQSGGHEDAMRRQEVPQHDSYHRGELEFINDDWSDDVAEEDFYDLDGLDGIGFDW